MRYYLDTSIWLDYFENRSDRFRPLGEWALALLGKIRAEKGRIIVSDVVLDELRSQSAQDILKPFEDCIDRITTTDKQLKECRRIRAELEIPRGDILHAILSRDHNCLLVSRDNHFFMLAGINRTYKPEELL
jgi:predicted nucleic acid-binding protein